MRDQSIDTFKTKVNYMLIERIDKEIIITTGSMHEMKKSLKILKGLSEAINRRRTDNTVG